MQTVVRCSAPCPPAFGVGRRCPSSVRAAAVHDCQCIFNLSAKLCALCSNLASIASTALNPTSKVSSPAQDSSPAQE